MVFHSSNICERLDWDSEHFGFPIASLRKGSVTEDEMINSLSWANEENIRCIYWLADPTDAFSLSLAFRFGFKFVDFRIELSLNAVQISNTSHSAEARIRISRIGDFDQLASIARSVHTDSRFSKDLNFPKKDVARLYERWIENHLEDPSLIVHFDESDSPCGYVLCVSECNTEDGRISLIGVKEGYQGKGIGRSLLSKGIMHLTQRGHTKIRVITQASNLAAQRLYHSFGFCSTAAGAWYHRWSS